MIRNPQNRRIGKYLGPILDLLLLSPQSVKPVRLLSIFPGKVITEASFLCRDNSGGSLPGGGPS